MFCTPSSIFPSQLSSRPLHTSTAPGLTAGLLSSQSDGTSHPSSSASTPHSRTKISLLTLASPSTRLLAVPSKATRGPSELIEGYRLPELPSSPALETLILVVRLDGRAGRL